MNKQKKYDGDSPISNHSPKSLGTLPRINVNLFMQRHKLRTGKEVCPRARTQRELQKKEGKTKERLKRMYKIKVTNIVSGVRCSRYTKLSLLSDA